MTIYRPTNFKFPLARGRDGIEIHPDGTFVRTGPGPDDRTVPTVGAWRIEGDAQNELATRVGDSPPRNMTIVQCDDDVLKVKWD